MTPERQRNAFELAQRRAAQHRPRSAFAGQVLGTIGESLYCYVPRLLRPLCFEQLLMMPYAEVACLYDNGSWAIDDLICLLERIADEAGAEENRAAPELCPVTSDGDSFVGSESVRWVPSNHNAEFQPIASPHSHVPSGGEELSAEVFENLSEQAAASCANDDAMQAEFDSMRQVLLTHATHPSLRLGASIQHPSWRKVGFGSMVFPATAYSGRPCVSEPLRASND